MLTRQELRAFCGSQVGAEETFPFDETTLVFKVCGKMFALLPLDLPEDQFQTISLKCDPDLAEVLRQTYTAVGPGYHLNKRHWNTVVSDGSVPDDEIMEMISHSYERVVAGLKKADRNRLKELS